MIEVYLFAAVIGLMLILHGIFCVIDSHEASPKIKSPRKESQGRKEKRKEPNRATYERFQRKAAKDT